ncbi:hypothetical protein, conserved [Eimeria praecox]|uniref:Transmembrane protein n=1 Tax=Eimeria praecox TaxID=51316 RepID=U6G2C0_9EIME|nr:hypothetical protein, conserved [Eimeria praecox]
MEPQDEASTTADVKEAPESYLRAFQRNRWMRARSLIARKSRARSTEAAATETPRVKTTDAKGATDAKGEEADEDNLHPSGGKIASKSAASEEKEEEREAAEEDAGAPQEAESKHAARASIPLLPPALQPQSASNSKRRALVWSAAFCVVLLAALMMGCRRIFRCKPPPARGPPLAASPKEMLLHEKALRNGAGELKRLWERVSPEVRQSFCSHYTPRVYGTSFLTSPLDLFEREAMRVFQKRPPQGATPQQYGVYVQQLQIARVVMKAAWTRLSQLQALEEFVVAKRGSDEDRYFVQPPVLPGAGLSSPEEELVSFRDFLDILGSKERAFPVYADASARKAAVPLALAQGLAKALQTLEFQTEMDAKVHRAFHELLLITGTPLPCGPLLPLEELAKQGPLFAEPRRPFFPAAFFSSVLAAFSRERAAQPVSEEVISTWGYQWTYEGASQRLTEVGERMRSSAAAASAVKLSLVSHWAHQQPQDPAASTDLACLAFYLL